MSYAPIRTAAPASLPVTRDEAKAQLQIDSSDTTWDGLIDGLLAGAVSYLDGWSGILGRCLITQTWSQRFECFDREFDLPFPDVSAVTVQYYDQTTTLQTYNSANYVLQQEDCGSVVELLRTAAIPSTSLAREDRVLITMTVGYGDATQVPAAIKTAILLMVGHWFANRETVVVGQTASEIPLGVSALLAPFRRVGV